MTNDSERLLVIRAMLDDFWVTFKNRPAMIGTPEEISAIFFYLDKIDLISKGIDVNNYHELSWIAFLIEKKIIVGAVDSLREKNNEIDFKFLQNLRDEYLQWRSARIVVEH
jgi:glycosyltransferase involved in cell wall biosynthesis